MPISASRNIAEFKLTVDHESREVFAFAMDSGTK